jgi:hypothetical protein
LSGVICSFMTVVVKTPFDVVSTRIYNQGNFLYYYTLG